MECSDTGAIKHTSPVGIKKEFSLKLPEISLDYTAEADWVLLREGEHPVAELFHVAYLQKDKEPSQRPITFIFNGGPGSASAYLHMGALGPNRVVFHKDGRATAPPSQLARNDETWLTFTDLVFIDPVGTGFSRIVPRRGQNSTESTSMNQKSQKPKKSTDDEVDFFGINRDIEALAEFIQQFLSSHQRWQSPVVIAGESYGGFRVAKLAKILQQSHGVGLSGAILISPALEFSILDMSDYDVLGWIDRFPSMVAAAKFHGKTKILKDKNLQQTLSSAEDFATGELSQLLLRNSGAKQETSISLYRKISEYIGMPLHLVAESEGRIPTTVFARQLLREEKKVCGLYDSSITVPDPYPDRLEFQGPDPTLYGTDRIFMGGINTQLRSVIGLETERNYQLASSTVFKSWNIDFEQHALKGSIGATDDLRYGMALNPHIKVLVANGYYDLVTPYFTSKRISGLMKLHADLVPNFTLHFYQGGHMFYTWEISRKALLSDAAVFYQKATDAKRT